MFGVAVRFKALCDSVSDLQQACACVLELLLVGQSFIGFVQLLEGLLHWPHALLTLQTRTSCTNAYAGKSNKPVSLNRCSTHNTKGFLVELVVLLSFDGNGLGTGRDVNWTLSLLPFGCLSLANKNIQQ